ncbi:hypothetical protein ACTXT7_006578 [Hymenolepis weldensis]
MTSTSNSSKVFWTFGKSFLSSASGVLSRTSSDLLAGSLKYSSNDDQQNCLSMSSNKIYGKTCVVKMRSRAVIVTALFDDGIDVTSDYEYEFTITKKTMSLIGLAKPTCTLLCGFFVGDQGIGLSPGGIWQNFDI